MGDFIRRLLILFCLLPLLLTACGCGGLIVTPTMPSTQGGTQTTAPATVPTVLTMPTENSPKDPLPEPERILLDMIHAMRSEKNLPALTEESRLREPASLRAEEIKTAFGHTRPDGRDWKTVLEEYNYIASDSGEALVKYEDGYPVDNLVDDWLASPTASVVLTNPDFTHVGVGIQRKNGYWYVVCILTAK